MRDGNIDYSRYTRATMPPEPANAAPAVETVDEEAPAPRYDANGRYLPNEISKRERAISVLLALLLLAYGTFGVLKNDLYVPGRRSSGVHLHDAAAWVMYGAVLCACLVLLSVVADHYDRRDNERSYRAFSHAFQWIGWTLFGFSLLFGLIRQGGA